MDLAQLSDAELKALQQEYQRKAKRNLNSDSSKRQIMQDRLDRINNEMRRRENN